MACQAQPNCYLQHQNTNVSAQHANAAAETTHYIQAVKVQAELIYLTWGLEAQTDGLVVSQILL